MPPKRGLQTELHPALRTSNLNLLKVKKLRSTSPYALTSDCNSDDTVSHTLPNPYLADSSKYSREYGPKRRLLRFHQKGEIVNALAEQRALEEQRKEEQHFRELELRAKLEERQKLVQRGELPDVSIGEDKYLVSGFDTETPGGILEWWDMPYVDIRGNSYRILDRFTSKKSNIKRKGHKQTAGDDGSGDETDDESELSIRYVLHPDPKSINKGRSDGGDDGDSLLKRVYLTKSEQKRLRRIRRQLQRKEHELRIKLGLEPKPEPKVKLSNMMRVMENSSNIVDPTKYEQQVREQVEQRRLEHERTNLERHEAALREKLLKSDNVDTFDGGRDSMCYVYKFKSLANPKIRYKLHMNSKQLKLRGCCLRVGDNGPGIIIVAGGEKQCRFFDNLVNRRIKWTENYLEKSSKQQVDMSWNSVVTEWSGYINTETHRFSPWFMKSCASEEELLKVLDEFSARHFYQS